MSLPSESSRWVRILLVVSTLGPTLLSVIVPSLHLRGTWLFTPRSLIYSHDLFPLLLAPWSVPSTISSTLSRLLQIPLLVLLPPSTFLYAYGFWIILALTRSLIGFILTRSVGWAYPSLFSHWALYEACGGIGPSLLAYLALFPHDRRNLPDEIATRVVWLDSNKLAVERYGLPILTAVFCWLEVAPWTYGIAIICIVALYIIIQVFNSLLPGAHHSDYSALPTTNDNPPDKASHRAFLRLAGLSFLTVLLPHLLLSLRPASRLPLPPAPSPPSPLLDVLVLSYPRPPDTATSALILSTTLSSYVPYLSPDISLSVFTHAANHEAFIQVREEFASQPYTTFHIDDDSHPNDLNGHYLHLAEAFRWAMEKDAGSGSKAEWTMLVEDDFPVCGKQGWKAISTVMSLLERDRLGTTSGVEGNIRAGFVGTGGSGIIIHHTYLPILIRLLRTYSSIPTPIPPNVRLPAPDLVLQDCILGRPDSLCQKTVQHTGSGEEVDSRLIISSRLVLDHIGGMATTTEGKEFNSDKWRCGWRHAFHGDEAVDVVVV